ncbi:phosphatase PAP2 family protein [Streptomyces yaizuensis]|uniref:Phosphatase PAP2 family protein n=1 Tax=Streptomyces yaizuensis TaxID=2989713 RepID=A0ABQ5P5E9_9ACTN|nr:phosphatase PAP2 family protein [Streptomyces sp. YSPA8]GLF97688.1 phosphatase PAP2 family protein [Streptomyces sp. YSPA8]
MGYEDWAAVDRDLLALTVRGGADLPGIAAAARGLSLAGEHAALWLAAGLAGAAADRARRTAWLRATAVVAGAHMTSAGVKHVVRRDRPTASDRTAARGPAAERGADPGPVRRRDPGSVRGTAPANRAGPGGRRRPLLRTTGRRTAGFRATGLRIAGLRAASLWTSGTKSTNSAIGLRATSRYSFPSSHAASAAAAATVFAALLPTPCAPAVTGLAAAMCLSRLVLGVHYPTDIAAGAALGVLAAHAGTRWAHTPRQHGSDRS